MKKLWKTLKDKKLFLEIKNTSDSNIICDRNVVLLRNAKNIIKKYVINEEDFR